MQRKNSHRPSPSQRNSSPLTHRYRPETAKKLADPGCSPAVDYNKLKVTFPPSVATHSPQQTLYLDETGLLRRQDYSVDIMGGTGSTNYATEPRDFGGLIVPTKRRIYDRQPDNRPNSEHVTVAVDIHTLALS